MELSPAGREVISATLQSAAVKHELVVGIRLAIERVQTEEPFCMYSCRVSSGAKHPAIRRVVLDRRHCKRAAIDVGSSSVRLLDFFGHECSLAVLHQLHVAADCGGAVRDEEALRHIHVQLGAYALGGVGDRRKRIALIGKAGDLDGMSVQIERHAVGEHHVTESAHIAVRIEHDGRRDLRRQQALDHLAVKVAADPVGGVRGIFALGCGPHRRQRHVPGVDVDFRAIRRHAEEMISASGKRHVVVERSAHQKRHAPELDHGMLLLGEIRHVENKPALVVDRERSRDHAAGRQGKSRSIADRDLVQRLDLPLKRNRSRAVHSQLARKRR